MDFRILGPLEVADDGSPIALGRGRQRALLALLLVHANEVVSADRLIDELWGERPPATAQTGLHGYVSQLRKLLGSGRVETRGSGYLLRVEEGEIDRERFEALARDGRFTNALALWRGPALADFAYEPWAQTEIGRLEELRLACLAGRIDADLEAGRAAGVIGELEALVAAHPLREQFRAQLMLALYRSGRQAEALAVYQRGRQVLVEELGLEPGQKLQELERAILNHDPSLELAAPSERGSVAPTGTVTFLFSDIEGSTRLVRKLGEDYGALLQQHHRLVRAVLGEHGGHEVDSQGDAFFFAFRRARDAVAAAVELQRSLASIEWPQGATVQVRIGINTGEPSLAGTGYHGLDVVRAARISSAAHGGQILVSNATRDLVGDELSGVTFRDRGEHQLKDLERPERLFQVAAPGLLHDFRDPRTPERRPALEIGGREDTLAAAAQAAVRADDEAGRRPRRRILLAAGLAAVALGVAATAAILLARGGDPGPVVVPNSVVQIDPETNEIVNSVPVGRGAVALAAVGRNLWVANRIDDTLTRVDTRTQETRTFGGFPYPISLAVEGPRVWVGSESSNEVVAIDGAIGTVLERVRVAPGPAGFVSYGQGSLWVSHGVFFPGLRPEAPSAFSRIDVLAREVVTTRLKDGDSAAWMAVGRGAAWISLTGPGELLRINALDGARQRIRVGSAPLGVAVGFGAVWVASGSGGALRRVNAATGNIEDVIEVGRQPFPVAVGAGSVWVGNHRDGTLSRIDPETQKVVATIQLDFFPTAVLVANGAVWVAISSERQFEGSQVFG